MASPMFSGFPSSFPSSDIFSAATVGDELDLQLPTIPTHHAHHSFSAMESEQFPVMESPFSSNSSDGTPSDEESHHPSPQSPRHQQQAAAAAQAAAAEQQRQQQQAQSQAHAVQLQLLNIVQAQQQQAQQQQYSAHQLHVLQQQAQQQQQPQQHQQQQQHVQLLSNPGALSHLLGYVQQNNSVEASSLLAGNSAATAALASMIPQEQQSQFAAFVESVKHHQQQETGKTMKKEESLPGNDSANDSKKSSQAKKSTNKVKSKAVSSSAAGSVQVSTASGNKWDELLPYFSAAAVAAASVNGGADSAPNSAREFLKAKRSNPMQIQGTTASAAFSASTSPSASTSEMPALSYGSSSSASSDECDADADADGFGVDGEEDADAKRRRLARKAELARMSRKRKKTRMGDLEAEVDRLQKEIATLRKQLVHNNTNPQAPIFAAAAPVEEKSANAVKMEASEDSEHEVKKVYDAIQQVIAAHKRCEEVNQQAQLLHRSKKARTQENGEEDDAQEEDEDTAAMKHLQEHSKKEVMAAMDYFVHLHTRSVDAGVSHLVSIRPHLVPILPLHFLHWLMSQADPFYEHPQSLWSSLFLHELKLNQQQMKDLNALRTTVRKQGKLLTDIEKGYRKLQTALKKQFTQRVENLEKIRSILDSSQLAKFLQWVQQYGPLCLKVQETQASIQPAQAQAQAAQAQAQAQAHAQAQLQMQMQMQAQAHVQQEHQQRLNSMQMNMLNPVPSSFLLNLAAH